MSIYPRLHAVSLALLLLGLPEAFGASAKGLFRIYNLTSREVTLTTELDGFENNARKERELSGKIPPDSAFLDHVVEIVDDNIFASTDATIRAASGEDSAEVTLHVRTGRLRETNRKERGLRIRSVITTRPGLHDTVISLFITDRELDTATWMSELRDDVRLSDLLIPGVHAPAVYRGTEGVAEGLTQWFGPPSQLEAGSRYFDLYGRALSATSIGCVQIDEDAPGTWDQIFNDCIRFLKKHPEEVVLMQLNRAGGDAAPFQTALERLLEKKDFQPYIYTGPWRRSNGTKRLTLPRLGDARGKIVLLNRVSDDFAKKYPSMSFTLLQGWGPYNTNAGHFAVQDTYDNPSIETKEGLIRRFFEATRKNSLLNLNYTSAVGRGILGLSPRQYAAAMYDVPYEFLINTKNPAAYDAVIPMDFFIPDDTHSTTLCFLNLLPDRAASDDLIVGQSYYFRPKTAADKILTIDAALQNIASVHARYTGKLEARPGQQFLLGDAPATASTAAPDYTLATRSRENVPLYLTEGGSILSGSPQDAGDSSAWIIEPVADTPYVRLRSTTTGLYATLRGGEVKDDTVVFLAPAADDDKGEDRQLWLADRVKARRVSR